MVYYEKVPPFDGDPVRGKRVLLALSGGADSVALLILLARERDAGRLYLAAAHFHHGIRGEDADRDAAFCRDLAERLGVEYAEGRADVPYLARESGAGLETAARDARYAFLRKVAREKECDAIALAHHRDDQAETVLMHILRGSGLSGLSGMEPERDGLVRPLLGASKRQIVEFLRANGFSWREDATNFKSDNPRNYLRNEGIPCLEKAYPGTAEALVRLGETARVHGRFMRKLARGFLETNLETGCYGKRIRLSDLPDEAVLTEALHGLLPSSGYEKIREVAGIALTGAGRTDVSKALYAECAGGYLYLAERGGECARESGIAVPGGARLPGICRMEAFESPPVPVKDDPWVQVLDGDALSGAVLRTRRRGDRISPLGAGGSKSLSDYFTDRKVDRPLRNTIPLVAVGNRVLWAAGLGISREAAIGEGTKRAVRLEIRMEENTNA